jgi:hypothetical protein
MRSGPPTTVTTVPTTTTTTTTLPTTTTTASDYHKGFCQHRRSCGKDGPASGAVDPTISPVANPGAPAALGVATKAASNVGLTASNVVTSASSPELAYTGTGAVWVIALGLVLLAGGEVARRMLYRRRKAGHTSAT